MQLDDLCTELHNYFELTKLIGTFTIEDGVIAPLDYELQEGQYYRIIGSIFNDGVYCYSEGENCELTNEVFTGAIWPMAVPPKVLELLSEIDAYVETHPEDSNDLQSESFSGYSYAKAKTNSGKPYTWRDTYRARLNTWRKL